MNLTAVGINHHTAPIEVREQLALTEAEIRTLTRELIEHGIAQEALIISTCNRTELFAVPGTDSSPHILRTALLKKKGIELPRDKTFIAEGLESARHLYSISSGIDSMITGDAQILSQVKEAYLVAREEQSCGKVLHYVVSESLRVAKRIALETKILQGAVTVSYAAVELARKIFSDLSLKRALVVGAGETAALAAKHLHERGLTHIAVTNRTHERADQLLQELFDGSRPELLWDFTAFRSRLHEVDIIITSTASGELLLSYQDLEQAIRQRPTHPMLILDIAVPRNVDPRANELPNVFVKDIDSLSTIVDTNVAGRRAEIPRAEAIIDEEIKKLSAWHSSLSVTPMIKELRDQFEHVRREELERFRHRFNDEQFKLIDDMSRRITNRLLHAPTVNLKEKTSEEEDRMRIELIRSLFALGETNSRPDEK